MRVALIHDFLVEYGGAERVLEALHEIWPRAPVYVAFYDSDSLGINAKRFKNWKIITSWGTRLPFWQKLISPYRIFSKSFFERFDFSGFDLVISSSNAYLSKAVRVPKGVHICYCHTPPRFLYGYPTASNWRKNPALRVVGEVINHFMRVWDFETAQPPSHEASEGRGRVDYFIANSLEVQARIRKFYRRESAVIYPPVDVSKFARGPVGREASSGRATGAIPRGNYFLIVSRLVAAKKVGIAVEVCAKLGLPLKVVGTGRELENLRRIAGDSTVQFLGEVSDQELIKLYQNCHAVIFPAQQEDFGLVPVEAMACGKPVIVNAEGGVLESVIDALPAGPKKGTGVYFDPPTPGSLTLAINNFVQMEKKGYFDPKFIQQHAQKFNKGRFKKEILRFVKNKLK